MSVAATPRPSEVRIRVPDVGFHVYETLVRGLPERTAIRRQRRILRRPGRRLDRD